MKKRSWPKFDRNDIVDLALNPIAVVVLAAIIVLVSMWLPVN